MNSQVFVKALVRSVLRDGMGAYVDLFENTDRNKVKDQYWVRALNLFDELSAEQKNALFEVIQQVAADAVSNVLGIIDGSSHAEGVDEDLLLIACSSGEPMNGDLQGAFLSILEDSRIPDDNGL